MLPHIPPLQIENVVKEQQFFKLPQSSLQLKLHGTVRAEVVDVLPGGTAIVRIQGQEVELHTEIPLQKDTTLVLKVLPMPGSTKALKLQLIDIENPKEKAIAEHIAQADIQELPTLLRFIQKSSNPQKLIDILVQKGLRQQLRQIHQEMRTFLDPHSISLLEKSPLFQQLRTLMRVKNEANEEILATLAMLDLPKQERVILQKAKNTQDLQPLLKYFQKILQQQPPSLVRRALLNATTLEAFLQRYTLFQSLSLTHETLNARSLQHALAQSGLFFEYHLDRFVKQLQLLQTALEDLQTQKPQDVVLYILASQELDSTIKKMFATLRESDSISVRQKIMQAMRHIHEAIDTYMQSDLKGVVSQLLQEDPHNEELQKILSHIQTYQLLGLVMNMAYYYLPLAWEDLHEGSLQIGKKNDTVLCVIYINFVDVGMVHVKLSLKGNDLGVDFFIDHAELRDFFQAHVRDLLDQLQEPYHVHVRFHEGMAMQTRMFFQGVQKHA